MKPESLFETTVQNDELDLSFVRLRDSDGCAEDREYIEKLWSQYKNLADHHFHDQLQRRGQFHSRIWEMRLACILMNRGFSVESANQGPDICISLDSSLVVHFEAVAPAITEDLERNHCQAKKQPMPIPEDETILRLTNSLQEKYKKYLSYLKNKLVEQSDAYVIAISAGNLHWAYDYSEEVAFAFLGEEFSEVSAVLFSPHHVNNRPEVYNKPEGSDLELFHNPFAKIPMPKCFLGVGREWVFNDGHLQITEDWVPKNLEIVPSCWDDSILDLWLRAISGSDILRDD